MYVNVEELAPLLLCALMFLILCMVSLNIFFIFKDGFYVRVNCWFCNQNTKVLYSEKNSFECPFCQQYNGFDKTGDYNKIITAQHVTTFNSSKTTSLRNATSFNGLCNTCNNNIILKATQLANYEPIDDRNYDFEIEHFEKQLEKSYKLCKSCRKHVNSTLKRQNAWLFANRLKNRKKLNKTSQEAVKDIQQPFWIHGLNVFLLVLTILTFLSISGYRIKILRDLTASVLPSNIKTTEVNSFIRNTTNINLNLDNKKYLPKVLKISEESLLASIGFTLQLFFTFFVGAPAGFEHLSKTLLWVAPIVTSVATFNKNAESYVYIIQIFSCAWLIYNYSKSLTISIHKKAKKKFVLKKLTGSVSQDEFSDEDDESSLEDSMSSISRNDSASSGHFRTVGNSKLSPFNVNKFPSRSPGLTRTSSLLNIRLNNDLNTAKNTDLNKDFNSLRLGTFSLDNSTNYSKNNVIPVNPFITGTNSVMNNSLNANSAYRNNELRSPFQKSPRSNLFVNVESENQYSTGSLLCASPNSLYSQKSQFIPTQNSVFRPISSPQTSGYTSNKSILSPPKFFNNLRPNEQLVFTVGSQNNVMYWPSSASTVFKNYNFESASNCDKVTERSRSSSRSSGFMSSNEINSRGASLPNSRCQSPERTFSNHLKFE